MTFANLSGGRDSTAMVINWLEMGNTLDYVLFCDTGYEFEEMYAYIDKLDSYLQNHFSKSITYLKGDSLERWAFDYPLQKGEHKGKLRGLPLASMHSYCTRELKVNPLRRFITQKSPNAFKNKVLIGYTYNEVERGRSTNLEYGIVRYPLHEWQWNEPEVEAFLRERGIANPLYKYFERTGCYLCPKQSKQSLYHLYKFFPHLWERMKEMETKAKELDCLNSTFKPDKSLIELESEFKKRKEGELFEIVEDYQEEHTCFCK